MIGDGIRHHLRYVPLRPMDGALVGVVVDEMVRGEHVRVSSVGERAVYSTRHFHRLRTSRTNKAIHCTEKHSRATSW